MHSCVEPLEARIAPAAVFTFKDVDGDLVTVSFSKGTLADLNGLITYSDTFGHPRQIEEINLTAAANPQVFAGANITISVVPANDRADAIHGDGFTNVGYINATGIDLGVVTIHGDLGKITAGDGVSKTDGLKGLNVHSFGAFGAATGAPDLNSNIDGRVGSLVVKGSMDVSLQVVDSGGGHRADLGSVTIGGSLFSSVIGAALAYGTISTGDDMGMVKIGQSVVSGSLPTSGSISCGGKLAGITIGGSLTGGGNVNTGRIVSGGDMGLVKIGGDVISAGASATFSGFISSGGKLAGVTIGGSLVGAGGMPSTGKIFSASDMGPVKIGGDVRGGSGNESGKIDCGGKLTSVTIAGSLIGGSGNDDSFAGDEGQIRSTGDMGPVKIGRDMSGGAGSSSGLIHSDGKLASVAIGGSILGGGGMFSGVVVADGKMGGITVGGALVGGAGIDSGEIVGGSDIGSVKIAGNIDSADFRQGGIYSNGKIASIAIGGSIVGPGNRVTISALGKLNPPASQADSVAIGKLTVGGDVENAQIVAGYSIAGAPRTGDASIGPVQVGGNWVGSDLLAGIQDGGDGSFGSVAGHVDDIVIPGGKASILAKIASITINGQLIGTPGIAGDSHAFAAQIIGSLKLGGTSIPLPGPQNAIAFSDPNLNDVTVEEI